MERLICVLVGYVFGLIQTGYLYGKKNGVDLRKKWKRKCGNNKCTPYYGMESRRSYAAGGNCFKMCCGSSGCTHDLWEDSYGYDAVTFYVCRNGRGSWT